MTVEGEILNRCPFCCRENIREEDRIIDEDDGWYAFIPQAPEIFGHILVTTDKKHIQEICSAENGDKEILDSMMEGVRSISNKICADIKNTKRVYVAMLGETPSVHIHFHLFPRYEFCNSYERWKWAEYYKLSEGEFEWRCFYAYPTRNFKYRTGFLYLGEIERTYNDMKKDIGEDPSKELIKEMTDKLKSKLNVNNKKIIRGKK